MGRGGGEGRVPSLMTAAVEREISNSYFFFFFFDVSSMGHSAYRSAALGERQLKCFLETLHERRAVGLRTAAFWWPGALRHKQPSFLTL